MSKVSTVSPCLWFDSQAEEAAKFYTSIFPNSRINAIARYTEAGQENHGRPPGSVMTVAFELDGQSFTALNGGPLFTFNEAISLQVDCPTQKEIDYYWDKLGEGGDPKSRQCGWIKDKFGLAWQVVPMQLREMMLASDTAKSGRAMKAVMRMKKLDIAEITNAFNGQ